MQDVCGYSDLPLAFLARYVRRRPVVHAAIVTAVVAAVGCSVGAQYGVKLLVDPLAGGPYRRTPPPGPWAGSFSFAALLSAAHLPWPLARPGASHTLCSP